MIIDKNLFRFSLFLGSQAFLQNPWEHRFWYLVPDEFVPVSRLLFDQFEDRLVGLHLPAAALGGDGGLELQLGPVGAAAGSSSKQPTERSADGAEPSRVLVSVGILRTSRIRANRKQILFL